MFLLPFSAISSVHSVPSPSLVNLQLLSISLHGKCFCQGTLSVIVPISCFSLMKDTSLLAYLILYPLPGFYVTTFVAFLTYFSSSTICLNQELPHRTIKSPYSSPLLPLRWSIITRALPSICKVITAKFSYLQLRFLH